MNKSNAGANTNVLQITLDVIIMVVAYLIDLVCFGNSLEEGTLLGYTILCGVFAFLSFPTKRNICTTLRCFTIWIVFTES